MSGDFEDFTTFNVHRDNWAPTAAVIKRYDLHNWKRDPRNLELIKIQVCEKLVLGKRL